MGRDCSGDHSCLDPDGFPVVDEALIAIVTYLAAKPPKVTSDKDED